VRRIKGAGERRGQRVEEEGGKDEGRESKKRERRMPNSEK
jgi:hypothetical protein